LNYLRDYLGSEMELIVSQPVVTFKETVVSKCSVNCLAKSPNGHNRLYAVAQPLGEQLVAFLSPDNKINNFINNNNNNNNENRNSVSNFVSLDSKVRTRILIDQFNWDESAARKIWSFAPAEHNHSSILCETTKGIQYLNEIKDSVSTAFQMVLNEGILCSEALHGVRFDLTDAVLHADAIHRGPGQIIPSANHVFQAAQLAAQPRLMEPIFLTEISTQQKALNGIFLVLNKRRAQILETVQKGAGNNFVVKAHLPVLESFGLTDALRQETSGMAFPQCTFSHFALVSGDPLDKKPSLASDLVIQVRRKKGLALEVPALDKVNEKL